MFKRIRRYDYLNTVCQKLIRVKTLSLSGLSQQSKLSTAPLLIRVFPPSHLKQISCFSCDGCAAGGAGKKLLARSPSPPQAPHPLRQP